MDQILFLFSELPRRVVTCDYSMAEYLDCAGTVRCKTDCDCLGHDICCNFATSCGLVCQTPKDFVDQYTCNYPIKNTVDKQCPGWELEPEKGATTCQCRD